MSNYLSICAILKNESAYLEEWLRFYDLIGVEHFYLYDNASSDGFLEVITPWVQAGRATVMSIAGPLPQKHAYADCLQRFGAANRWIGFLDIDEFLFSPVQSDLRALLEPLECQPGVVANWVMFGASGHQSKPAGLTTINYTMRCPLDLVTFETTCLRSLALNAADPRSYFPICAHVKSIVDPRKVLQLLSPHHFKFAGDAGPVTASGQPLVLAPFTMQVEIDRLRINHYFSRSWQELSQKVLRGRADIGKYELSEMIERNRKFDAIHDTTIFPLATRVQKLMHDQSAISSKAAL